MDEAEVRKFFAEKHTTAIPADTTPSDVAHALRDARGKELMSEGAESVEARLHVSRQDVTNALLLDEIANDVQTMLGTIRFFADH